MKDPIIDYPEKITTPVYFAQSIYKTKIAWTSWAVLFISTTFLTMLSITHDKYDGVIFLFFMVCFFLSTWFSIGGFIDGIKSMLKMEDAGILRIGLIVANFSIFGLIAIGLTYLIILNLIN